MPVTLWQEALFIYLVFWVLGEGLEAWPIHRDYPSFCAKECLLLVLIFGMLDRPRIGGMQGNTVLALWKANIIFENGAFSHSENRIIPMVIYLCSSSFFSIPKHLFLNHSEWKSRKMCWICHWSLPLFSVMFYLTVSLPHLPPPTHTFPVVEGAPYATVPNRKQRFP